MVDTDKEENERRIKYKVVFQTGGGKATKSEKMEYIYIHPYCHGVQKKRTAYIFQYWKGVDKYQEPIETNSLSYNLADVFPEVASLINSHVEYTVIINDITQDNNKVLVEKINKTVKFHRLQRSVEDFVSTFQSVVEAEQLNGRIQGKKPLSEN